MTAWVLVVVAVTAGCGGQDDWAEWCTASDALYDAREDTPTEGARTVAAAADRMAAHAPDEVAAPSQAVADAFDALRDAQSDRGEDAVRGEAAARDYFRGEGGDLEDDLAAVEDARNENCG